jgi:ribosomal protein L24
MDIKDVSMNQGVRVTTGNNEGAVGSVVGVDLDKGKVTVNIQGNVNGEGVNDDFTYSASSLEAAAV